MASNLPRYEHVDCLRAIAASLIVWQHVMESFVVWFPAIGSQSSWFKLPHELELPRIFLIYLFMISGFVIPKSIRGRSWPHIRDFWIRRLFRLYPAYWLSLIAGYLVVWRLYGRTLPNLDLVVNVFCLQKPLGFTSVQGVYWTLAVELYFYSLCTIWLLAGWLHRPRFLAIASCLAVFAAPCTILYYLGTMHFGALFRYFYDEPSNPRYRRYVTWVAVAALVRPGLYLMQGDNINRFSAGFSTFFVIPTFFLAMFYFPKNLPRLAYLGAATYSVYLLHPSVYYLFAYWMKLPTTNPIWRQLPLEFYVPFFVVLSYLVGIVSYRLIELPAIGVARKITSALKSRDQAVREGLPSI